MKFKLLRLFAPALLTLAMVSCGPKTPAKTGDTGDTQVNKVLPDEVTNLVIDSQPTKTEYYEGEKFDGTGLKMTATLGDGSTENANLADCEILPGGELTKDVTEIKVVYFEGSVTIPVTVKANPVTELSISHEPAVISYTKGQRFSTAGLIVSSKRENGTALSDVPNYTIKIDDKDFKVNQNIDFDLGEHTVTLTYGEKSVDYKINIFDGQIIETENLIDTDSITSNDKNFVEKVTGEIRKVSDGPSSGGSYAGFIRHGDIVRVHVFSDVARKANLVFRASSAKEIESGNGGCIKTDDLAIGKVAAYDVNGETKTIKDNVILPGSLSRYYDQKKYDSLIWFSWKDVNLGECALEKGDNTITIDTSKATEFGSFNFDRIELHFLEEESK